MGQRRYALRDDQWERIEGFLPGREGHIGGTAKDNRLFIEAVLYRYRAGMAWRDLPERFGDFRVIHTRHTRWSQSGVRQRVFEHPAQDADNEYAKIDFTIVRAHRHSAGAKGGPRTGSDRALKRRADHQNPRHMRRPWQPHGVPSDPWTGSRSARSGRLTALASGRY